MFLRLGGWGNTRKHLHCKRYLLELSILNIVVNREFATPQETIECQLKNTCVIVLCCSTSKSSIFLKGNSWRTSTSINISCRTSISMKVAEGPAKLLKDQQVCSYKLQDQHYMWIAEGQHIHKSSWRTSWSCWKNSIMLVAEGPACYVNSCRSWQLKEQLVVKVFKF